ncbi:MAG: DUF4271 domain-containing protein [Bacteroidales bacterium]|nr:DUF4271 domain-containing protein [Bacteroidales bacterium]
MNTAQDSIIANNVEKDTVFSPLYLQKSFLTGDTSYKANISFKQYLTNTLNDSLPPLPRQRSLFTEKTPVYHRNLNTSVRNTYSQNLWVFGVFMFVLCLIAILFRFTREDIKNFISGCFSKNQISITTKDGERVHPLSVVPVIFICLPLLSLLFFFLADYFNFKEFLFNGYTFRGYVLYFALLILLFVLYFLKVLLIKFFGWMFKSKKISNYYLQIHYNFDFLLGLLSFLPVLAFIYVDSYYKISFLYISLCILIILVLMRLVKSFSIIITSFKFSHFYLFFYLCTLELLPIILLCKFLFF